jgi:SNF2 family DNA or RNA helicase
MSHQEMAALFASHSTGNAATWFAKRSLESQMGITLRDYQEEAVLKYADRPGALCLDEMGTGKTIISLATDKMRRQQTVAKSCKTLIICSAGKKVDDWEHYVKVMQPELKVVALRPKRSEQPAMSRARCWNEFLKQDADVFVMHWQAVQIMVKEERLTSLTWLHIIADEVQAIKNRKAATSVAIKKIKAQYKTGLSGTPAETPEDMWSILNWLYPRDWRSYWIFIKKYTDTEFDEKGRPETDFLGHAIKGDFTDAGLSKFWSAIEPFSVRRLKKDVLNLEDKNYIEHWVQMSETQTIAYNQMRDEMVAWVRQQKTESGKDEISPIIANAVVAKLVRLQQFACAYAKVVQETKASGEIVEKVYLTEPSSKLDAVQEDLLERLALGQRVAIFSQFRQLIELMQVRLDNLNIPYGLYTGTVASQDRGVAVDDFQSGKVKVFLGTIDAGGEGIDLFTGNCIIFLSRSWRAGKNLQAEDRLHRSGQAGIVDVVDYFVENTVEIDKKDRVEMKWSTIQRLLGDI